MKNRIGYIVAVVISLFVGICSTLIVIYYIPDKEVPVVIQTLHEQSVISATDTIAPAVDMVYDAVVTVSNYTRSLSAIGTGFVYKTDDKYGYILTNNHVVNGARTIRVTNTQDVTVEAILLGSDAYADLAVLRVDKSFVLKVAKLGDSTDLKIGDTVFTVGTPVSTSYANSVTKGIVSGLNRTVTVTLDDNSQFMMEVLQTNAAINPGNSGGPLVDLYGNVVGINTLKLVEDQIEGMGFAIPIEMATSVLDRLENGQKIERPMLGVSLIDANNSYALYRYQISLNKSYDKGVVIVNIEKQSSAESAGLKPNDVILQINGIEIKNTVHFKYVLYKYSIGDTIEITYERNGKTYTVKTKINNSI